jgi:hypothetical protein
MCLEPIADRVTACSGVRYCLYLHRYHFSCEGWSDVQPLESAYLDTKVKIELSYLRGKGVDPSC